MTWLQGAPYLLLATEDAAEAAILAGMLRLQKISCDVVATAADAWQAFKARDYDMLLMNLRGPLEAGLEAAQAIRKLERSIPEPRVPIFIMADRASEEQRLMAKDANVDDVLERTSDASALVAVIESVFAVERRTPRDLIPREVIKYAHVLKLAGDNDGMAMQILDGFDRDLAATVEAARMAVASGGIEQVADAAEQIRKLAEKFASGRLKRSGTLFRRLSTPSLVRERGEELLLALLDISQDFKAWRELGLGRDVPKITIAVPVKQAPAQRKRVQIFSILRKQVGEFSGDAAPAG